jgi:hypothetical protein
LVASGAPAATVAADTRESNGFTFDKAGNVWVLGATTADPPLPRYPAAMLTSSGAKTPDVTIDSASSTSFGDAIPGPRALAFYSAGNLWVSVVSGDKVVRFTPAQIAVSGTPTAAVELSGVPAPAGLAFDGTGNLWVTYQGPIVRLTPIDLAGTGAKTVTPAIQINPDVLALTEDLAFDEGGGLWVASTMGKFVRLAPTQLGASGTVVPAATISSADVGYAGWVAIYPAPAATPLAHRLP